MRFGALLFALVAVLSGALLGDRYISRLPNHAGYWLVHVEDRVDVPPLARPRRVVMIVVDGLRRDAAESMQSTRILAARGQCRVSDQGSYTVSRPVYALLSTGLEADRTGSRNNELTAPLVAESVWEVARRSGRRVRVSSHLPWWQQLFPRGFDETRHLPEHAENVFAAASGTDDYDIDLFHPLYVDEMGHLHGAASPEYAAAVMRVDTEIAGLLDRLDLERDTVILTADHGHRAAGGHGGEQSEIREVLACFAGAHVRRRDDRAPFDGRLTAPLLSVLTGVPFPANMRAGEDRLDDLWQIADVDAAYEADRRAAIERFRAENAKQLHAWLGDDEAPTWTRLYARERNAQWLRAGLVTLVLLAFTALRCRRTPRDAIWLVGLLAAFWLIHHAVLGDFDYTVVNRRAAFVPRAFVIAASGVAASVALHRVAKVGLKGSSLRARLFSALVLTLLVNGGHVFVYGWPLGFPLPPQPARYLPFFLAFVQVVLALAFAIAIATAARTERRRRVTDRPGHVRGGDD